jgi:hypothetical protein
MDMTKGAFAPIYGFIHQGFDSVRTDVMAIVIALIIVLALMKTWGQLIPMLILAVVAHLLIVAFAVPLVDHKTLAMPPLMDMGYWRMALSLAVGYLIMMIVMFFLKKNVFKMG